MSDTRRRPRPRTASRVGAVQALFQSEQSGTNAETVIDEFVRHRLGQLPSSTDELSGGYDDGRVPDADAKLFGLIVRHAVSGQDAIDALIASCLPADWPFARLDPVLRAVLRCGGAELSMEDGPPSRVVINEYLDVAAGFFEGDEPRMVNGLLDRMARTLRASEFAAVVPPEEAPV